MSIATTMKTNTDTLGRLRTHGQCGDSLDHVLNKLLDQIEDINEKTEIQEGVIDDEEGIIDDV